LNLGSYSGLAKSAREAIARGVRLHEEAMTSKDWDRMIVAARKLLQSAAKGSKGCTLAQYHLGRSYQTTMLFKDAERWLQEAADGNPGFYEARVALAQVKFITKKLDAALSLSEEALKLCPTYFPGIEAKAGSLIRLNRLGEARDFLQGLTDPAAAGEKESLGRLKEKLARAIDGPGWSPAFTTASANYKVLTSVSQEFADEVSHRVELIHSIYRRIFPDIEKPARQYEIWVYPDQESYLKAGAPQGTAGYYDPLFRKLVLFRSTGADDTFTVLQHEAFHQYLHDYLEIAPSWFNEGLGDYFGAYEYYRDKGREYLRPRPSPGRLAALKAALGNGTCSPLANLMQMGQERMYSRAGVHYAQAWSLIYFIVEGDKQEPKFATSAPRKYVKTLQAYFAAMRAGKNMIEAFHLTFGRLDFKKFEEEWLGYVSGLELPPRR
jgi:tetratricopeptide (TPR) repeat protein